MARPSPHNERFMRDLIDVQDRLYAYAYTLLADADAAADVVQETNLVLWRKAEQYEPGTEFGAWACKVAYFEVLKRRQRTTRDKLVFDDALLSAVAERTERLSDTIELRRRTLRDCLAKLPDGQRSMLEARYEPGATVDSIARALGRPIKSIYQTLYRIRATVVACVERVLSREAGR